jgi:uncharacterized protein (DUF1800 family)
VARLDPLIEHLLRRAGFGVSAADADVYRGASYRQAVDNLLAYPDSADVDASIGAPGFMGITASGAFTPNSNIAHARQRWIFRMVHSPAPLMERMALVLHHHFATGYTKVAGTVGTTDGARLMAAKPEEDPVGQVGQIELLRRHAFGSFRDLLVAVAQDPAMLYWLDGVTNVKARPQENFARELMELFTFGVGNFTESDVYAAARVFTGWNLTRTTAFNVGVYTFLYNQSQHDTSAKEFTFPVGGSVFRRSRTIPARNASAGLQDGIDLITALAYHPETARRLATRLWTWFVSETQPPTDGFINRVSQAYFDNRTSLRAVMRAVLTSQEFTDPSCRYQRYSWPVEFVVRTLREVGPVGFSANDTLTPLTNMGQQLYEPPDVNGWELGPAWFSTGGMLARLNFAAQVATNQRVALRDAATPHASSPDALIDFAYERLTLPEPSGEIRTTLMNYLQSGGAWTGSGNQLLAKAAGLVHMLAGSAEYQLV